MPSSRLSLSLSSLLLLLTLTLGSCTTLPGSDIITVGQGPVIIQVPSTIRVMAVDGYKVDAPSLYRGYYRLALQPGQHTLIARYEENWNNMDQAGYIIRWPPVEIQHNFVSSESYQLQHPPVRSLQDAEKLAGLSPLSLAVDDSTVRGTQVSEQPQRVEYVPSGRATDRLQQLQQLWHDSLPADQAAFREWLNQQP